MGVIGHDARSFDNPAADLRDDVAALAVGNLPSENVAFALNHAEHGRLIVLALAIFAANIKLIDLNDWGLAARST